MSVLTPVFGSQRAGKRGRGPVSPILGTIADLVATPGDTTALLTFSSVVGAVFYVAEYKEATSETWLAFGDLVAYPGGAGLTVTGLTNTTLYDFRVTAFDGFVTTTSNEDSATPATPGGWGAVTLTVSVEADTAITVAFDQVADDEGNPAKYQLRYRTPTIDEDTWAGASATNVFIDTDLAIGVEKTHQFTGLSVGTPYGFMLIPFRGPSGAADAFGEFSNVADGATTGTPSVLGTISDLAVSPRDTEVDLAWSPAENATSHQPEYKLDSSGTWLQFGSPLGAGASSVTVDGLTNDLLYDFRIVAGDGATTTNSNEVSTTPVEGGTHFGEPAAMTFTAETTFADLASHTKWKASTLNGSRFLIATGEGSVPRGGSSVGRTRWPAGSYSFTNNLQQTNAQSLDCLQSIDPSVQLNFGTIYGDLDIYIHDEFVSHNSSINKLWWTGRYATTNANFFWNLRGSSTNLEYIQQNNTSEDVGQPVTFAWNSAGNQVNNGAPTIGTNQWARVIYALTASTTSEAPHNGSIDMWMQVYGVDVDPVKKFQFRNVWTMPSAGGGRFTRNELQYIWGGAGDQTLAADFFIDFGYWYLSGKV